MLKVHSSVYLDAQEAKVLCITSAFLSFIVRTVVQHLGLWGYSRCSALVEPVCQTKYPSLTSSVVTAALLILSPCLRPPPRLEAEWTVLKSREAGGLEGRTPDEEETAEAEALDAAGCPLGSMTVLMTRGTKRQFLSDHLCSQYESTMKIFNDLYLYGL